jgi:hypothetical protein
MSAICWFCACQIGLYIAFGIPGPLRNGMIICKRLPFSFPHLTVILKIQMWFLIFTANSNIICQECTTSMIGIIYLQAIFCKFDYFHEFHGWYKQRYTFPH